VAQVLGGIVAGGVLYLLASGAAGFDVSKGFASNGFGAHSPGGYSMMAALLTEVVMTMFFLIIILGATDKRAPAGFAPIAIGLALTLIHLISIPVTNTSVNPARSTGVALYVGDWAVAQLWLFWLAPIVGAVLGAGAGSAGGAAPAPNDMWRQSAEPAAAPVQLPPTATGSMSAAGFGSDAPAPDQNWFIPTDFDTQRFLGEDKQQFVAIQKVWDSGNVNELRSFLTDDLLKELQAQLSGQTGQNHTEVVLLNAELLGIEKVSDGHLASVRFSGMLREQVGAEAFRFEEVWNLFKPEQGGWLLAGIQQVPVTQAS
jgi:hypothetical protein